MYNYFQFRLVLRSNDTIRILGTEIRLYLNGITAHLRCRITVPKITGECDSFTWYFGPYLVKLR